MKVQDSPGLATPSPPSEHLILPLVGSLSDGQVTNSNKALHYYYVYNTVKLETLTSGNFNEFGESG